MFTLAPEPSLPPRRGRPIVAWLVIIAAVVVVIVIQMYGSAARSEKGDAYFLSQQITGRATVGAVQVMGSQAQDANARRLQEEVNRGPYVKRLRFVVMIGELEGPGKALDQLDKLRELWEEHAPSDEDARLTGLLETLYRDYDEEKWDAPALSDDDRRELRDQLDWFGELALAPANGPDAAAREAVLESARRAYVSGLVAGLVILALGFAGFVLLVIGAVLARLGILRFHFMCGSRNGGVYAETFALWLLLYLLPAGVMKLAPGWRPPLWVSGVFALGTLAALAWPVLRGESWQRVRQDLGLWTRRNSALEVAWGFGCWLAVLPLALLGALAGQGLINLHQRWAGDDPFGIPVQPSHPASEWLLHGGAWERVQIVVMAAVIAPIIEETMFRGVLYRHLREVVGTWPRGAGVLCSALAVSFVFAVIHPQGAFGVPALMALAFGFTLARELRGSLVGPMAAHGLSNALVALMVMSVN
jgi:membrane protease YdiL (CAAX protease family)